MISDLKSRLFPKASYSLLLFPDCSLHFTVPYRFPLKDLCGLLKPGTPYLQVLKSPPGSGRILHLWVTLPLEEEIQTLQALDLDYLFQSIQLDLQTGKFSTSLFLFENPIGKQEQLKITSGIDLQLQAQFRSLLIHLQFFLCKSPFAGPELVQQSLPSFQIYGLLPLLFQLFQMAVYRLQGPVENGLETQPVVLPSALLRGKVSIAFKQEDDHQYADSHTSQDKSRPMGKPTQVQPKNEGYHP